MPNQIEHPKGIENHIEHENGKRKFAGNSVANGSLQKAGSGHGKKTYLVQEVLAGRVPLSPKGNLLTASGLGAENLNGVKSTARKPRNYSDPGEATTSARTGGVAGTPFDALSAAATPKGGVLPKISPVRERSEERIDWLAMQSVLPLDFDGACEHLDTTAQAEAFSESAADPEETLTKHSFVKEGSPLRSLDSGLGHLLVQGALDDKSVQRQSDDARLGNASDPHAIRDQLLEDSSYDSTVLRHAEPHSAADPDLDDIVEAESREATQDPLSDEDQQSAPYFPTLEEVVAYAECLNMIPEEDGELLWIAEQALMAPLPDGWYEEEDQQGRAYFWDSENQAAHWKHPYDDDYKFLYEKLKRSLATSAASKEEVEEMAEYLEVDTVQEPQLLWAVQQAVLAPLPPGWEEIEDEKGIFFFDRFNHESQPEHPMDHIFRQLVAMERAKLEVQQQAVDNEDGPSGSEPRPVVMSLVDEETGEMYQYDWQTGTRLDQPSQFSKVHPVLDDDEDSEATRLVTHDVVLNEATAYIEKGSSQSEAHKDPQVADSSSEDGKGSLLYSGLKYLQTSLSSLLGRSAQPVH